MVKAYIETDFDVDLGDFAEEDLVDFLEDRGYKIYENADRVDNDIENLYYDWLSLSTEKFNLSLKNFFNKHLDKIVL